jgi:hypothetical protein
MLSQYTKLFYIISLAITFAITLWALNSPFIIYERTNMPDMHIKLLNDYDNSASYGKVLFALYILISISCIICIALIMLNNGKIRKIIFTFMILVFIVIKILLLRSYKINVDSSTPITTFIGKQETSLTTSSITMIAISLFMILAICYQYTYGVYIFDMLFQVILSIR